MQHSNTQQPSMDVTHSATCICGWGDDCRKIQRILTDANDPRGGRCKELDMSQSTPKAIAWRSAVVYNLFVDERSVQNWGHVFVARHHWSMKQLTIFDSGKRPSTPVKFTVAKDSAYVFDPRWKVEGTRLFFHVPNVPKKSFQTLLQQEEVSSDRCIRVATRRSQRDGYIQAMEQKRAQQNQQTKQAAIEREFKDLSLHGYNEMLLQNRSLKRNIRQKDRAIRSMKAKWEVSKNELEEKIAKLERAISSERRKNYSLARESSKRKRKRQSNSAKARWTRHKTAVSDAKNLIANFLADFGGISRLTLTDPEWHRRHPDASRILFKFQTYDEMCIYVEEFFTDVPRERSRVVIQQNGEAAIEPPDLTDFEKIVLVRYFLTSSPHREKTAKVYGVVRTTITKYLDEWAPRWGKFGEHCSICPVPHDFFDRERPDEYEALKLGKMSFQVDGKDSKSETIRKNDALRRRERSAKDHCDGVRVLNFASGTGFSFEHTRAFGARAEEVTLMSLHGSLRPLKVDILGWKDYGKIHTERKKLRYWSALDDLETAKAVFGGIQSNIETDDEECDDVEEQRTVSARGDSTTPLEPSKAKVYSDLVKAINRWYDQRKASVELQKELDQESSGKVTTGAVQTSLAHLNAQNWKALNLSPQNDPEEFFQQLEFFERMHRRFESGDLRKNLFSSYLFISNDFRKQLLAWMGSSMVPVGYTCENPPDVWLRLAKLPPDSEGLGDKGFEKTERSLPFLNRVRTPRVLRSRKVKQYHELELLPKRSLCTGRYTIEVDFSRFSSLDGMKETIPYENLCLLPYMVELGHAQMNLGRPLRKPGRNSGLPPDYWLDEDDDNFVPCDEDESDITLEYDTHDDLSSNLED